MPPTGAASPICRCWRTCYRRAAICTARSRPVLTPASMASSPISISTTSIRRSSSSSPPTPISCTIATRSMRPWPRRRARSRSPDDCNSPNFREVAVPAEARLKAARTRDAVRDQRFAPVVPLLDQRLAHAEPVTADSGAPIGAHANLREAGDVAGQLLRFLTRAALLREVFAQADLHALLRRHFSAGENDLQRATQADDARQTHGASVDQRHAPTAAIDAEVRVFRHHPEIAPSR